MRQHIGVIFCEKSFVTRFEKTRLPHTQYQTYDFTRNGLLAQYTIIFHCWPCSKATSLESVAAFLRSCVSLEWHFGTIRWSWLSCIGAWRVRQVMQGWPMSVIFNFECCEHRKGPVGPLTGPLAFNCLCIPFCTPLLSSLSSPHPPPLLLPPAISLPSRKELLKTAWISGVESYSPTQL